MWATNIILPSLAMAKLRNVMYLMVIHEKDSISLYICVVGILRSMRDFMFVLCVQVPLIQQ